jgi:hypothetical protein
MPRSYLFPGRDTEALSPAERQLETLYDRIDRPGNRITPQQFFQSPEAAGLLDQLYGGLTDRIPPGSQIVQQTPSKVTYRDAEGYEHTLTRKPDGQFTEATNRPAVLPDKAAQSTLDTLRQRVEQGLGQPLTLAELDPQTAAALQAINAAEATSNEQQLADLQGQLIARLYGNGVNESSIANEAAARFAEGAGRVRQQQQSDAAQRLLGLRQYLTNLTQANRELQTNLFANLTGQQNQRDIAGAGLDIDLKKLAESTRQFDATNYLQALQTQLERERLDAENGPLNKVLKVSQIASNLTGAAGGGISAYDALRRRF